MSDVAQKLRQWYVSLLTAGHEVTASSQLDLLKIADHIDKQEAEIERLRVALRDISEMRYRAASKMRARAKEALGDD